MKNFGVILAGGLGSRFSSQLPKQYFKINNREVISYPIESFEKAETIDEIIIVVNEQEYIDKNFLDKYHYSCVCGGKTRNQSIGNAIKFIQENYKIQESNIVLLDAVRPFVKYQLIDQYIGLLQEYEGVITVSEITDSLGNDSLGVVDRSQYYLIQSPEAYPFQLLSKYFDPESDITAVVQQLPPGLNIYKNFNMGMNLKITYPHDFYLAEILLMQKIDQLL